MDRPWREYCEAVIRSLEAEITQLRTLVTERDNRQKLLEEADAEVTTLRAALAVAGDMAKLLTTKCQYTLHSDKAILLATRFHSAMKKVGK